ncbi:MAG: serine protease [Lachnospiraceae bacterium]|nr:serine protease [Lachnospiraceae bacterium]
MGTWEILGLVLLLAGFVLIGIELVVPGFGLPGICGILCLGAGIVLTADTVEQGITITIIVVVILAVMVTIGLTLLKKVKPPFVLTDELKADNGFLNSQDLDYLIGKSGVAATDLRPGGKCDIEGVTFDVRTEGNYISKGSAIRIKEIRENTIIVQEN